MDEDKLKAQIERGIEIALKLNEFEAARAGRSMLDVLNFGKDDGAYVTDFAPVIARPDGDALLEGPSIDGVHFAPRDLGPRGSSAFHSALENTIGDARVLRTEGELFLLTTTRPAPSVTSLVDHFSKFQGLVIEREQGAYVLLVPERTPTTAELSEVTALVIADAARAGLVLDVVTEEEVALEGVRHRLAGMFVNVESGVPAAHVDTAPRNVVSIGEWRLPELKLAPPTAPNDEPDPTPPKAPKKAA